MNSGNILPIVLIACVKKSAITLTCVFERSLTMSSGNFESFVLFIVLCDFVVKHQEIEFEFDHFQLN